MIKRFDLYGWQSLLPSEAAKRLAALPGVVLQLHDSSYRGGEYYRGGSDSAEELIVQHNFRDEDGHLAEPEFPDYKTIVYVTWGSDGNVDPIREIRDLTLLRTELL